MTVGLSQLDAQLRQLKTPLTEEQQKALLANARALMDFAADVQRAPRDRAWDMRTGQRASGISWSAINSAISRASRAVRLIPRGETQ